MSTSTTQIPSILISRNKFNRICNEFGRNAVPLFALFAQEFFNHNEANENAEEDRMQKREQKLIKKLKRQNIISDIIWFLLFALFAFLLFINRN